MQRERETLLVEWVDPSGNRPMQSYSFRYLPVNVHLYGIPKQLRSMCLVEKIINKIGVKDTYVIMSKNAMFRILEFVIARIILDVSKPLLDSVTINLSKDKKIKVYIHYEKLVKICSFCGHLFHNVSSCSQRQQIIWKLNPVEAAKVPEVIYGMWRSQESEIPAEAKEEKDSDLSHDPYIQSFKNYFQKSALTFAKMDVHTSKEKEIFSCNNSNLQLVPSTGPQSTTSSTILQEIAALQGRLEQQPSATIEREGRMQDEISENNRELFQVSQNQGTFLHAPIFGFQAQQFQTQLQSWHPQMPFTQNHQWQQHNNPFIFNATSQPNLQGHITSHKYSEMQMLEGQAQYPPALPPPDNSTTS